jgi:predicted nucleic acid-binding protein
VTYVLDASIAACWCYHDEQDQRADAAFDLLGREYALVPLHWWFEIRNVVLLGEKRRRVTEQHVRNFLSELDDFPIEFASMPDGDAVLGLARRHGLTFYDAVYLELALRENIPLATLDKELAAAARAEGVALIAARSG